MTAPSISGHEMELVLPVLPVPHRGRQVMASDGRQRTVLTTILR